MVWLRIDDRELDRQAWERVEDEHGPRVFADCLATWLALALRCARRLGDPAREVPDGYLADTDIPRLPQLETAVMRCMDVLEDVGLLERRRDGLVLSRWDETQPSSEHVIRRRAAEAAKKKRQRARSSDAATDGHANSEMMSRGDSRGESQRPVPSRPVEEGAENEPTPEEITSALERAGSPAVSGALSSSSTAPGDTVPPTLSRPKTDAPPPSVVGARSGKAAALARERRAWEARQRVARRDGAALDAPATGGSDVRPRGAA